MAILGEYPGKEGVPVTALEHVALFQFDPIDGLGLITKGHNKI